MSYRPGLAPREGPHRTHGAHLPADPDGQRVAIFYTTTGLLRPLLAVHTYRTEGVDIDLLRFPADIDKIVVNATVDCRTFSDVMDCRPLCGWTVLIARRWLRRGLWKIRHASQVTPLALSRAPPTSV